MVRQMYQLIPSRDDDQRILTSDWPKGTSGHTQPREVVLNATLLSLCKKLKISIGSFQFYC